MSRYSNLNLFYHVNSTKYFVVMSPEACQSNPCPNGATCVNEGSGFSCICPTKYHYTHRSNACEQGQRNNQNRVCVYTCSNLHTGLAVTDEVDLTDLFQAQMSAYKIHRDEFKEGCS